MSLATVVTPEYEYTNGIKAIFWLPQDKIANKQHKNSIKFPDFFAWTGHDRWKSILSEFILFCIKWLNSICLNPFISSAFRFWGSSGQLDDGIHQVFNKHWICYIYNSWVSYVSNKEYKYIIMTETCNNGKLSLMGW